MPIGRCIQVALLLAAAGACGPAQDRASGGGVGRTAVVLGPWHVISDSAVLRRGDPGAWDDGLIDPGAMIFHRGKFHSFYNAIRTWPSPLAVGYATSDDGLTWIRQGARPVFSGDSSLGSYWTVRATSVIVEDDRWVLFFSVSPDEGSLQGSIRRASAPGPEGPWTIDATTVMDAGAAAWTVRAVGDGKVVPVAEGYVLYFTGVDAAGVARIGRASSGDLTTWTVLAQPILEPGSGSAWDAGSVSDPSVARTPDGAWVMTYRGSGERGTGLGVARSEDGITWDKADQPALGSWEFAGWDTIYYSAIVALRERHYLYFEVADQPSGNTQVYTAWRDVSLGR